jgi:hypothetical protein
MVESVWRRRLRWRLRGAWQWPAFALLTVVDAMLLVWLPFEGDGAGAVGAFWFATFLNLLAVALVAPLVGALVRRRRRDLPALIARDYAGTALLLAITVALVAGGLAHRSTLVAERADQRAVSAAVHKYLVTEEPAFAGGVVDTVRLEPERYRACVTGPEDLPLCLFVNTDQSPAGVLRDPAREPNLPESGRK